MRRYVILAFVDGALHLAFEVGCVHGGVRDGGLGALRRIAHGAERGVREHDDAHADEHDDGEQGEKRSEDFLHEVPPCGLDGLRGVRCAVRRCCAVARLRAVPPLVRFVVDARGGGCRGSAAYPKDSLPENRPVHETPAASPTRGNEIPIAFPEAVRRPSGHAVRRQGFLQRSENRKIRAPIVRGFGKKQAAAAVLRRSAHGRRARSAL